MNVDVCTKPIKTSDFYILNQAWGILMGFPFLGIERTTIEALQRIGFDMSP